jgi:hypothetical protein
VKKESKRDRIANGWMRPEYDFSGGIRGKHAQKFASGANVVVLDPDVADAFPTEEDVNETLRAVSRMLDRQRNRKKHRMA